MAYAQTSHIQNDSSEHASAVVADREPHRAPSFIDPPAADRPSRLWEPVEPDALREPTWRTPLEGNTVNGVLLGRSITGAAPRSGIGPEEDDESRGRVLVSRLFQRPLLISVALVAAVATALVVWGPSGGASAAFDTPLSAPQTTGAGIVAGDLDSSTGIVELGSAAAPIQTERQPQWLTIGQPLDADGLQLIAGPRNPDGTQAISGLVGRVGADGSQGEPSLSAVGSQGEPSLSAVGMEGAQGPAGEIGPRGLTGPQGSEGPQGLPGPSAVGMEGAQGSAGEIGLRGLTGPQGLAGPQGETGPLGPEGALGPQGEQGLQGLPGPAGALGPQGDTGLSGPAGPQGVAGLSGPAGPQGSAGQQGPLGLQGPPGLIGVETVSTLSPIDSSSAKAVTASCPSSKRLIGGGAALLVSGPDEPEFLALTANAPLDDITWRARGIETQATGQSWQLKAYAICADEAPQ